MPPRILYPLTLSAIALAGYAVHQSRRLATRLAVLDDDLTLTNKTIADHAKDQATVAQRVARMHTLMTGVALRSELTARRVFADRVEYPA